MPRPDLRRALAALACGAFCTLQAVAAPQVFFDDFDYPDADALGASHWTIRTAAGHPGVPGAHWGPEAISLIDDPAQPGNRVLRLTARTDGRGTGTLQAQLCHERKFLAGTYAARVRFADAPRQGRDGDPVIQTFYAASPLRFAYDPLFSEMDWEYLANGGWGSPATRLYAVAWQTVRLEPWDAYNASHEEMRSFDGWHVLMMQVADGRVQMSVDGRVVHTPGGRHVPVAPMAISFNLWFSPSGLLADDGTPRVWNEDVDWVFHARDTVLSFEEVLARVQDFRHSHVARHDDVPAADYPPLPSRCDI